MEWGLLGHQGFHWSVLLISQEVTGTIVINDWFELRSLWRKGTTETLSLSVFACLTLYVYYVQDTFVLFLSIMKLPVFLSKLIQLSFQDIVPGSLDNSYKILANNC